MLADTMFVCLLFILVTVMFWEENCSVYHLGTCLWIKSARLMVYCFNIMTQPEQCIKMCYVSNRDYLGILWLGVQCIFKKNDRTMFLFWNMSKKHNKTIQIMPFNNVYWFTWLYGFQMKRKNLSLLSYIIQLILIDKLKINKSLDFRI